MAAGAAAGRQKCLVGTSATEFRSSYVLIDTSVGTSQACFVGTSATEFRSSYVLIDTLVGTSQACLLVRPVEDIS